MSVVPNHRVVASAMAVGVACIFLLASVLPFVQRDWAGVSLLVATGLLFALIGWELAFDEVIRG